MEVEFQEKLHLKDPIDPKGEWTCKRSNLDRLKKRASTSNVLASYSTSYPLSHVDGGVGSVSVKGYMPRTVSCSTIGSPTSKPKKVTSDKKRKKISGRLAPQQRPRAKSIGNFYAENHVKSPFKSWVEKDIEFPTHVGGFEERFEPEIGNSLTLEMEEFMTQSPPRNNALRRGKVEARFRTVGSYVSSRAHKRPSVRASRSLSFSSPAQTNPFLSPTTKKPYTVPSLELPLSTPCTPRHGNLKSPTKNEHCSAPNTPLAPSTCFTETSMPDPYPFTDTSRRTTFPLSPIQESHTSSFQGCSKRTISDQGFSTSQITSSNHMYPTSPSPFFSPRFSLRSQRRRRKFHSPLYNSIDGLATANRINFREYSTEREEEANSGSQEKSSFVIRRNKSGQKYKNKSFPNEDQSQLQIFVQNLTAYRSPVVDLLRGHYADSIDLLYIIDCRFTYEYEGGHIQTALSFPRPDKLEKFFTIDSLQAHQDKKVVFVFHCEYSKKRGPNALDRKASVYPKLNYPQIYLLNRGYRGFFANFSGYCEPSSYRPMFHPDFQAELVEAEQVLKRVTKPQKYIVAALQNVNIIVGRALPGGLYPRLL